MASNTKKTTAWFVGKVKELEPSYGTSKVMYEGMHKKVTLTCSAHGDFEVAPSNFLKDVRCAGCWAEVRHLTKRHSQEKFLEDCRKVHGDTYDYSLTKYTRNVDKVTIICKAHGEFSQRAEFHRAGSGCTKCYRERSVLRMTYTKDDFVLRAKAIYGDKFDYGKVNYVDSKVPVELICPEHGSFFQVPNTHLTGTVGCPKCVGRISVAETQIADYLRARGIAVMQQVRDMIAPAEIDLYLPDFKVAIEYNGAYWHADARGNTHTMRSKTEACAAVGVRLIHIFDREWIEHKSAVLSMLDAAVGMRTRLGARKCDVKMIGPSDARAFMDANHISGFQGAAHHIALSYSGNIVAVASVGKSRFNQGSLELIRYATSLHVVGGLQKILNYCATALGVHDLESYCDLRTGTGESYRNAGFVYKGVTEPDYWWYRGDKLLSRYATQKHKLKASPVFGEFYSDDLSEREICEKAGYVKVTGVGNSKWLWTNPNKIPLTPAKV